MLIVRSPDGKATVGLVCFYGIAHLPKLPDLGYLGTGGDYEDTINRDDIKRLPLPEWPGHGVPMSGHPPIISRRVQVHSPAGPLPPS
jgi:hypothetical protein